MSINLTLWSPLVELLPLGGSNSATHTLEQLFFTNSWKYVAESAKNGIYVKFYVDLVPPTFFSIELRPTAAAIEGSNVPQMLKNLHAGKVREDG